jgi:hypothetical protein
MTVDLAGKVIAGKLVVTGVDLTGQAVSLSQPVPAGAFLSAPGIGGSIRLVGAPDECARRGRSARQVMFRWIDLRGGRHQVYRPAHGNVPAVTAK